jgi:N-acetylmuramoyl-L-alanine amidase
MGGKMARPGARRLRAMRVRWGVVLGLLSGLLLLPPAGSARTTNDRQHHSTKAHAPITSAHTSHKVHSQKPKNRTSAPRGLTAATSHVSAKQARDRLGTGKQVARHGAIVTHPLAVSHARNPTVLATRPLIVINPGHGGRDPGAIGVSGTLENTVTLATALELRRCVGATGRYRVALTRTRDRTISLAERLKFARDHDADLLIAIHADASPDRHARGASVYVSSSNTTTHLPADRGSSGRIAHALSGTEPHPEAGSAWLQYSMIEQLSDDVRMVAAPARNAHLYVLGARTIPSVLLEIGFLSNRQDESQMKQQANRRVLVQAIKDAIDDYFAAMRTTASRT